jgi:hypothetical protein
VGVVVWSLSFLIECVERKKGGSKTTCMIEIRLGCKTTDHFLIFCFAEFSLKYFDRSEELII